MAELIVTLRRARAADAPALYEVMRASVLKGTVGDYDEAQRRAWAPDHPAADWVDRLAVFQCFIAESEGRIAGFMALAPDGELPLGYVLPDRLRRGIGSLLYARTESEARLAGLDRLSADASRQGRDFLLAQGWQCLREDSVTRDRVALPSWQMEKQLQG